MSGPFKTDVDQLQLTTTRVGATVETMLMHAKEMKAAVDFVNRWTGDAGNAFRSTMGVNTDELSRLVTRLSHMADTLGQTGQGVVSNEAEAVQRVTAAQGGLTGAPLNRQA